MRNAFRSSRHVCRESASPSPISPPSSMPCEEISLALDLSRDLASTLTPAASGVRARITSRRTRGCYRRPLFCRARPRVVREGRRP